MVDKELPIDKCCKEAENRANIGFPCVSPLNMLLLYTTLSSVGNKPWRHDRISQMLCRLAEHFAYLHIGMEDSSYGSQL